MVGFAFKLLVPEGIRKFFTAAVCGLPWAVISIAIKKNLAALFGTTRIACL